MSVPTFAVDETTLVYAFRYALGRRTTAPSHIRDQLWRHWQKLVGWTQRQICEDIRHAIATNDAGAACDVETWGDVLTWARKTEAKDECGACGRPLHNCLCSHDDDADDGCDGGGGDDRQS